MHLAHQMVVRFVKAAALHPDYLGCLGLSSWYPSNQGLLLISSRCPRKRPGTPEFKEGSAAPGQETSAVLGPAEPTRAEGWLMAQAEGGLELGELGVAMPC